MADSFLISSTYDLNPSTIFQIYIKYQFSIGVKSGMLTVTASHEEEINDNGFISKSSSSVSRCIQLPNKFIKDSIKAECVGATVHVSGEIDIDKVEEVNSGINIPISFE